LPGGAGDAAQGISNAAVPEDDIALICLRDQSKSKVVTDPLRANETALSMQKFLPESR